MMHAKKPYARKDRVGPLIHRKLSEYLAKGFCTVDGIIPPLTFSEVDVAPDFGQAKVYFNVLGEGNNVDVKTLLEGQVIPLQNRLASELNLRKMPKLIFLFDDVMASATRMDALLDTI